MKAESFYKLTDTERKVTVLWLVNSTSATIHDSDNEYVGEMAILMLANPSLEQFTNYVEGVIDQVLAAYFEVRSGT